MLECSSMLKLKFIFFFNTTVFRICRYLYLLFSKQNVYNCPHRGVSSYSFFGSVRTVLTCPLFNASSFFFFLLFKASFFTWPALFCPCSTLAMTSICLDPKIFLSSSSACAMFFLDKTWMKTTRKYERIKQRIHYE